MPSSETSPLLDARITLSSSQTKLAQSLLQDWTDRQLLTAQQQAKLLGSLETQDPFDWQRLAKYTWRLSIICLVIAMFSLLTDRLFQKLIEKILALPAPLRAALTFVVAIAIHVYGYYRQQRSPLQVWANEAVHALGCVILGLAAVQLAESIAVFKPVADGGHPERWRWVVYLLAFTHAGVGISVGSNLIWSTSMVAFGYALGLMTAYASGWGAYFMDMNYPIRFVLFGLFLIGMAQLMQTHSITANLWSTTRVWGLLYMFLALWILSVFGNDNFSDDGGFSWRWHPGQPRLLAWSLMFAIAAGVCIWHGLRFVDSTTKGFGLAFLAINLYTRFFEFFWDRWYKPLFFAVLAASFAILGRYAENLRDLKLE